MKVLLLLLAACGSGEFGETGDTGGGTAEHGVADLQVGEVADMVAGEDGVQVELVQSGTYIMILVSTDDAVGVEHGYGPQVQQRREAVLVPRPSHPATPWAEATDHRPGPRAVPPHPSVAEIGERREFSVWNGSRMTTVEAEAVEVTGAVVLWEDRTTPNEHGSVDQEKLEDILRGIETIVLPRQRQVFGEESDVDGDERLAVLLSYTVNQYGAQAYVSPCDIGLSRGCAGYSNGGEVIYLGYLDPEDSRASANGFIETAAHELNHLIYSWHKFVENGHTGSDENIYVTEGMAALAQDLSGYNNGNQYVWGAALDMSDLYGSEDYSVQALSVNDLLRGSGRYDPDRDGALRGGGYLLFRYLFEQAGGLTVGGDGALTDQGGVAFLRDLFSMPEQGVDAVEAAAGMSLWDVALDWYTAMVVSGRGLNDEPVWNYEARVEDPLTGYSFGVDTYALIHEWHQLEGPLVQSWDDADGFIRAGGVEYLEVTVEPGELSVPVGPAAGVRGRVFRIE